MLSVSRYGIHVEDIEGMMTQEHKILLLYRLTKER